MVFDKLSQIYFLFFVQIVEYKFFGSYAPKIAQFVSLSDQQDVIGFDVEVVDPEPVELHEVFGNLMGNVGHLFFCKRLLVDLIDEGLGPEFFEDPANPTHFAIFLLRAGQHFNLPVEVRLLCQFLGSKIFTSRRIYF